MRGAGGLIAQAAAACKFRPSTAAISRLCNLPSPRVSPSRTRSIYTSIAQRPYGFSSSHERQHGSDGSATAPNSFLPVPFVTEQLAGAHHTTDLFSRLLKERIVAVYGPIEDRMAATITASLLFLESDSDAPISLYINSPGGSVSAGLSIYDTMQYIASPVHTIVLGQAASMGSLLAAAGTPGKRFALPHATIMRHQPSGGYSGTSADIQIHAKEILRIRNQLNGIYARHLNEKSVVERRGREVGLEEVERLMDRDYFMSADEARDLGVVDEVLVSRKKLDGVEKKD